MFKAQFIARFKTMLTYKFTVLSGGITQIIFAFFKIFILTVFIKNNINSSPMNIAESVTYIWLTQIFFALIPWNVNWEDMNLFVSGNIVYEMARPGSLLGLLYSRTLSWRLANTIMRAVPLLAFNLVVLPLFGFSNYMIAAGTKWHVMLFVLSLSVSFFLSSMITVFLYSLALHLTNASNFLGVINSVAMVLSGTVIPLSFFPEWGQWILRLQPFKGVIDTPAMILIGAYSYEECYAFILLQLMWTCCLWGINYLLFRNGEKRMVVQGG